MLFNNFKEYLEKRSEKSTFKVSIESSGGYITFSNSGQRGGRKFFTLGLVSIKKTLQDILNNLSVFEDKNSYIEQEWRNLSQYYTDDTIKSIATVQTKPLFTTLTKIISWANEKELEDESLIDLDKNSIEQTIQKLDELIIYFTPKTIEDMENVFKNWLKRNVDTSAPVSSYPLALKEKIPQYLNKIGENDYQNLFECTDIEYLNTLYKRLLKGGDLYQFNKDTQSGVSSASVNKYIEFLEDESNRNPFNDNEEKTEIEKLKFSNEPKGKLDFSYKNILFKGVPGTGKSRAIDTIIEKHLGIKNEKENILRVNIHSASSNSDLMQGISISTTDDKKNVIYKEKQGAILSHIFKAIYKPKQPFVLILEEIQENSLNELIGDLIYLIENKKRTIIDLDISDNTEIAYDELFNRIEQNFKENNKPLHYVELPSLVENSQNNTKMIVPDNLFIFCTSNYRDDKKVIEDNLLRRFDVIEIYPKNREQIGKNENNEYIFKSDDISKFLEKLNSQILKQFKNETHPDRYMIGHANWLDIQKEDNENNQIAFYKALLKVIIEFKEVREIDFDGEVKPILENVFKDIASISDRLEQYLKIFYIHDKLELKSYKNIVDILQQKVYKSFL